MIEVATPTELAEVLVATWRVSGLADGFPMTTTLDRALKAAIDEGAFPFWVKRLTFSRACEVLHFGQPCTRVRCLEMAPALSHLIHDGAISRPDDRRESRTILGMMAAETLLYKYGIKLTDGVQWGTHLRVAIHREASVVGTKHYGREEEDTGSEEDESIGDYS